MNLARTYRPQQLQDIIGQTAVVQTLKNALLAAQLPSAILLSGVRGVGKTSLARIIGKSFNCEQGITLTPCGSCPPCEDVLYQRGVDYHEIDGASHNGVEAVRALCEQTAYLPTQARNTFYVIDEVHMLSTAAFNALLKTLEEPPLHVYFILCTTEVHKIPQTVASRCAQLTCFRVSQAVLATHLIDIATHVGWQLDTNAARRLAQEADGAVRDGLSLLDHVLNYLGENTVRKIDLAAVIAALNLVNEDIVVELLQAIVQHDCAKVHQGVTSIYDSGLDCQQLLLAMAALLLDLAVCQVKSCPQSACLRHWDEMICQIRLQLVKMLSACDIQRLFKQTMNLHDEIVHSLLPQASFEMGLLRLAQQPAVADLEVLLQQLQQLADRLPSSPKQILPASVPPVPTPLSSAPPPAVPPPAAPTAPAVPTATPLPAEPLPLPAAQALPTFHEFVQAVHNRHPALASVLEHAHVLELSPQALVLTFAAKSYYDDAMRDLDTKTLCKQWVSRTFGQSCQLKIVVNTQNKALPPTLAAGNLQQNRQRLRLLEHHVREHAIVQDIQLILGASLEDVQPWP